jgi:hypothetical protein
MQIDASVKGSLKNSTRWWEDLSDKISSTLGSLSKGPEGLLARLHLTLACILIVAGTKWGKACFD